MKKFFLLVLSCVCMSVYAGHFTDQNSRALCASDAGLILQNDHLYYFSGDELTIRATYPMESGLKVAPNASAYIYVQKDQKLYIYGGNGVGRLPGGAGIEVPQSSTLYILGSGLLEVYGGNGGCGFMGESGDEGAFISNGLFEEDEYKAGDGGAGGSGGGGAGAGIGGIGGMGGAGASGVKGPILPLNKDKDGTEGIIGNDGAQSEDGANGGKVYIVGGITVYAYSGQSSDLFNPSSLGFLTKRKRGSLLKNDFVAGGGAGGGNGNNGLSGAQIGGGGPGAAGAGSGSTGGLANVYTFDLGNLLKQGLKIITQKAIDAIIAYVTKDPNHAIAVIEIPLVEYEYHLTAGKVISKFLFQFINIDLYPLQINGGGGQGSFSPDGGAKQVDGLGFHSVQFEYTNLFGKTVTHNCPAGGNMGMYGQIGSRQLALRSPWSKVNANVDVMTPNQYPQELLDALTFTLKIDTTELVVASGMQITQDFVFGDILPAQMVVPAAKEPGRVFLGYSDEKGVYWYNDKGLAIPNVKDTLGNDEARYITPNDVVLKPRWNTVNYILVRHWQENADQSDQQYSLVDYELRSQVGIGYCIANAHYYDHFMAVKSKDSVMVQSDVLNTIDFYYMRDKYELNWNLPTYATILSTDYSPNGSYKWGSKIRAPRYAKDNTNGGYYELTAWQLDNGSMVIDTMPANNAYFVPTVNKVKAAISYNNQEQYGTVTQASTWLGTDLTFEVTPKDGWELDTCYATYYSLSKVVKTPVAVSNSKLVLYAEPDDDSVAVKINYRGVKHSLYYTESTVSYRHGSMTMFINGDSVLNDGKVSSSHPVRYADEIWVRPEPTADNQWVCTGLMVKTKKGVQVPVDMIEEYNAYNKYQRYFAFTMPNEDVDIEATYGTLSTQLVNLRIRSSLEGVRVYSNRGELLESEYIYNEGYMVQAGELVWMEIPFAENTVVDSMHVAYGLDGQALQHMPIERMLFMKNNQTNAAIDTTKVSDIYMRYAFFVPTFTENAIIELKMQDANFEFLSDLDEAVVNVDEEAISYGIYNTMGVYLGTDWDALPAGIYIMNGKKYQK